MRLLFLILLLNSFNLFAQPNKTEMLNKGFKVSIDLKTLKYEDLHKGKFKVRDYSDFNDISNEIVNLPHKVIYLAIPNNSNPRFIPKNIKSVSHNNLYLLKQYCEENEAQIFEQFYKLNEIPKNIFEVIGFSSIRNTYCAIIKINPVISQNNKLVTIEDFDLEVQIENSFPVSLRKKSNNISPNGFNKIFYNSDIAYNFQIQNKNKTNNKLYEWINWENDYLKITVGQDVVYRITKDELKNNNVEISSINPKTLRLFSRGKEIPIFVNGEEDNSFDDSDYIDFYGSMNYDSTDHRVLNEAGSPPNEYLNRYSDSTIYWLTWGGAQGLRLTENVQSTDVLDTLDYYTEVVHVETDRFLDNKETSLLVQANTEWLAKETWIYGNHNVGERSHKFSVDKVVPEKIAKAFYKVISWAADVSTNAHKLGLKVNNFETVHDSIPFNKYEQKILYAEFNSNQLAEGENNIKSISYKTNASINTVQEDWFEVEYPRYLSFNDDKMIFSFNQIIEAKEYIVKVGNVTSENILIYKIEPEIKRITNYNHSNSTLTFTDNIKQGDKYIILENSKLSSCQFDSVRKLENLISDGIQAEYILLTDEIYKNTAESYAEFISENYQLNTQVVYVDDIYNQFNFGFFAPEPVKEFLKSAYANWQEPKPKYLFIVGEANYDYKNNRKIDPYVPNIVPAFGHPVSDTWFTIWDSTSLIPQMMVGRLPAINISEFEHYFNKHKEYLQTDFDKWNKSYLLFSGGKSQGDQNFTRSINNALENNIFSQQPVGGYVQHFYSTTDPKTNFGPFEDLFIDSVISEGAVITSFVGHSGTKIWDNGIEDVTQLKSNKSKKSFISDFGCSTGKFGEPDIVSFSEAFTNGLEGDAIGYIGNSSLGFSTTSSRFPNLFYEELSNSESSNIGEAHLNAKVKLLSQYGQSDANKVFLLCNNLFCDPIINIAIPKKSNLNIEVSDLDLEKIIDDNQDSTRIIIHYRNLGLVDSSKFLIKIVHTFDNQIISENIISKSLPLNEDVVKMQLPVKDLSGVHKLNIKLDYDDKVDELNEDDNNVNYDFNVITSRIRNIIFEKELLSGYGNFKLLNSLNKSSSNQILVQIDTSHFFTNPVENIFEMDTLITPLFFNSLVKDKRYWLRFKLNSSESDFLETYSFVYDPSSEIDFAIKDEYSLERQETTNLIWTDKGISVDDVPIKVELASTGYEDGGIATIKINGTDYPDNPRGCGFHNVVINKETLEMEEYTWFNFWAPDDNYNAYYSFLSNVESEKLLAISISGSCGGYNLPDSVVTLLESFGSVEAKNIKWATAWIFLGEKGKKMGSVPEKISFSEKVEYDTTFYVTAKYGRLLTKNIKQIKKINGLEFNANIPNGSSITAKAFIDNRSKVDTITIENPNDFVFESMPEFSSIQFEMKLNKNQNNEFPSINKFFVDTDLIPELATNYQVVSIAQDTLQQGDSAELQFYVYNVGETPADSFKVKVEVESDNNTKEQIFEQMVTSIDSMDRKKFNISYPTTTINGNKSFVITIDSENNVKEFFEDNNYYLIPFYVMGDTTKPSLNVTFDGQEIFDGDYIAKKPNIKVELSDPSLVPITDTTGVDIYFNNKRIPYSTNTSILSYSFNQSNPKLVIDYRPELEDGEYELKILAKDASGNVADSSGYVKNFTVSGEAKILNLYNYPNPFSDETYFTFKLTQIPEEIKIKVYTVAGRLVKVIELDSSELNYDFNKIYWDGKDEDGDELANGVYLYKTIMKTTDKTESVTQKLAIVR